MNKWVYNFEDTPHADKTSLKNLQARLTVAKLNSLEGR